MLVSPSGGAAGAGLAGAASPRATSGGQDEGEQAQAHGRYLQGVGRRHAIRRSARAGITPDVAIEWSVHALELPAQRLLLLAVGLLLGEGVPLVVGLLAAGQRELDLGAAVLEVQRERDQREAALVDLALELVDLVRGASAACGRGAARGWSRCPGCTPGCARRAGTPRRRRSRRTRRPGSRDRPAATSPRCRRAPGPPRRCRRCGSRSAPCGSARRASPAPACSIRTMPVVHPSRAWQRDSTSTAAAGNLPVRSEVVHRVHGVAVEQHGEVQVAAGGPAGAAGVADDLAARDALPVPTA